VQRSITRVALSLRADALNQLLVAVFPCLVVELGAEVLWQKFQQFLAEEVVVIGLDIPRLVLCVEVSQLSEEGRLIVQQTNGHVETTKNSFSVGLELGRIDVFTVDAGEHSASLWVVVEQFGEQLDAELYAMMSSAESLVPLVLQFELLQHITVVGGRVDDTQRQNDGQYQLHDVTFTSGRSCRNGSGLGFSQR